jgi:hypothetical protein
MPHGEKSTAPPFPTLGKVSNAWKKAHRKVSNVWKNAPEKFQ